MGTFPVNLFKKKLAGNVEFVGDAQQGVGFGVVDAPLDLTDGAGGKPCFVCQLFLADMF